MCLTEILMFFRLLLLFTLIPLIEVWLLFKLSGQFGFFTTIAIVLGTGIVGAWLAKLQGFLALNALRAEIIQGRMPTARIVDGVLILIAGVVLITPGILTDVAGIALLLPPVRSVVRKVATAWFTKHVQVTTTNLWQQFSEQTQAHDSQSTGQPLPRGEVIDARVVETRVEE